MALDDPTNFTGISSSSLLSEFSSSENVTSSSNNNNNSTKNNENNNLNNDTGLQASFRYNLTFVKSFTPERDTEIFDFVTILRDSTNSTIRMSRPEQGNVTTTTTTLDTSSSLYVSKETPKKVQFIIKNIDSGSTNNSYSYKQYISGTKTIHKRVIRTSPVLIHVNAFPKTYTPNVTSGSTFGNRVVTRKKRMKYLFNLEKPLQEKKIPLI